MRPIDADALKGAINKATDVVKGKGYDELTHIFDGIINLVDRMPTADVVQVVRCKDCKYRDGSVCDYSAVYVRPNGYCQWGERREDGEET